MKNVNITILLIVLMCMFGVQVSAEDIAEKNSDGKTIYYNFNSDGSSVTVTYQGTSYSSYSDEYSGEIVIPETVTYDGETYSVTSIGDYAFYRCSGLTSVTIPNSVTSIGEWAFYRCSGLTKVIVPNFDIKNWCSIKFGENYANPLYYAHHLYSDENTEITELVIPDDVTSIGNRAFWGCSGLTSVTIPNSVTSIGSSAFWGCSGLQKVIVPNIKNWCSIKFGDSTANPLSYAHHLYSDENTEITKLVIPDGVTSIGSSAFSGCSGLTSVTIPNSVTSIGTSAFSGCSGLTSVTIPNSVTSIGSFAFRKCSGLTSVTIPNSVTSIGENAFSSCTGLTSINIPNSVTSIGIWAFYGCSGLTSVTIPNSVTSIGENAFSLCSALSSIVVNENNTEYDSRDNCNAIIDTKTNTLVIGCKNTIIPEGVTSIGESAFYECRGLTSVTIPENVTSIGENAFNNCSGLKSVKVMRKEPPIMRYGCSFSDVSNILLYVPYGSKAKYEAADYWKDFKKIEEMEIALNKTTLTIIEGDNETLSVTYTPTYADGRSVTWTTSNANVATVDAQGKVTAIAEGVVIVTATTTNGKTAQCVVNVKKDIVNISFADPNVKTVCVEYWDTDSNGKLSYAEAAVVSSLGEVFRDKKNIASFEELQYFTGLTEISNNAFSGCAKLTSIIIPDNVASIGRSAFLGCSGLTSVTIPESVASIGESAFSGCSGLASIAIPGKVTSIDKSMLLGCSGLTSVTISENVTSIGTSAFSGCSGLTSITIPEGVASIGESAFSGCSGLAEIIIPDSVESIGKNAFSGCTGIHSVTIPSNVSSIGRSAFAGCSNIRSVKWNAKNCNSSNNPFSDAPNIYEFVVGKDVINIPNYLLYGMNNLRSLTIGAGVLTIGNQGGVTPAKVFWMPNTPPTGCNNVSGMVNYTSNDSFSQPDNSSSLQNIMICRYLSSIFEVDGVRYVLVSPSERTCNAIDCVYDSTLCEVNIDKTVGYKGINLQVKDINPYTFYSNTYIKKAYIDTDGELGAHAFENCNNMTVCTMGDRITKIDDYAFSGCKVLHRAGVDLYQEDADYNGIIVSKAVSHIGDYAFYGCSNIKNVIMEDRKDNDMQLTLGSNGSSPLFSSCPLDSVYIGRNITYSTTSSAGYSPFYRNTSLRTVHITDKETEISDNEFYGCTNLKNVRIGDGVTYIGNWAFSGCSSIEYFSFGSAMQSIGKEAFSDCTAMTKLISHAMTPPVCDSQALDDISKWECTLSVPKGTVSSYQQAAQWKEFFFIDEGATGILRTISNDSKSFKTYNINGYEQNGQQRGLNIIRMSDGTVKKMIVK